MSRMLTPMDASELESLGGPILDGPGLMCTRAGTLPLTDMDVHARVLGTCVHLKMVQTFHNTTAHSLEATYIFPLPDQAAVSGFAVRLSDRVVEGVLKERQAAREEYDAAMDEGRHAAILEQERADAFTVRVGNLVPGERAVVTIALTWPLFIQHGEALLAIPLVLGHRYTPGIPLPGPCVGDGVAWDTDQVPDASRVTPPVLVAGHPNPVRLAIRIDIDTTRVPIDHLRCSLHQVRQEHQDGSICITLEPGERLDRDFILRYGIAAPSPTSSLAVVPDQHGDQGTFLLTVVPPALLPSQDAARDVVMVLDRSSSMEGWKFTAANHAMQRILQGLAPRDRFEVLAFSDQTTAAFSLSLQHGSVRNQQRAVHFLRTLRPGGGTVMATALRSAAKLLHRDQSTRVRILLLITDGQVTNEASLLSEMQTLLHGVQVHVVGMDEALNAGLLRPMAEQGRGVFEPVESEARLLEVLDRLEHSLHPPVLRKVTTTLTGADLLADTLVPREPVNVHAGVPITVCGRYHGDGPLVAHLSGTDGSDQPWTCDATGVRIDHPGALSWWGRQQLQVLESEYQSCTSDSDALAHRIVQTSLQTHTLCRFTAFVAVDVRERVDECGERVRVVQPVEPVRGWEMWKRNVNQTLPPAAVENRLERTQTGVLRCKYAFLAPEQVLGQPKGPSVDVYLLAQLTWELLHLKPLWDATSEIEILERIAKQILPEPLVSPDLAALEPLLRSMLAREPGQRPTIDWVVQQLDAVLAQGGIPAVKETLTDLFQRLVPDRMQQAEACLHQPPVGCFGPYALLERLNVGRFSETWSARVLGQDGQPHFYCLRRIHPSLTNDEEAVNALLNELRILHPHVVENIRSGRTHEDNTFFALSELVVGTHLGHLWHASRSRGQPLPPRLVLQLIHKMALGIQAAHAVGACCGTLDRYNVLINRDGAVKIQSFKSGPPDLFVPRVVLHAAWPSTANPVSTNVNGGSWIAPPIPIPVAPPARDPWLKTLLRKTFWKR